MKEEYIKLKLPLPISINTAFCNAKKGRIKSQKYIDWEELAFYELLKQTEYTIKGDSWLFVEYEYHLPCYTKQNKIKKIDVENFVKVTSDFLGNNIRGFDDSKIKTLLIKKINDEKKYVIIKIKEIV